MKSERGREARVKRLGIRGLLTTLKASGNCKFDSFTEQSGKKNKVSALFIAHTGDIMYV